MCEFKVGDYVACKTNKYGITTKGRPCQIRKINGNSINVYCFGDDGCYDVPQNEFIILENFKPFNYKEKVIYDGILYEFLGYEGKGCTLGIGFSIYTIHYKDLHKIHRVGGLYI